MSCSCSDRTLEDHMSELKSQLKKLRADISEEKFTEGLEAELSNIISACDVFFKESYDNDTETVLYDIAYILAVMPSSDGTNKLISSFIEKLYTTPLLKLGPVCLRVLWVLFRSLDHSNPNRFEITDRLIFIANREETVGAVFEDVEHLQKQYSVGLLCDEEMRKLLRSLYEALVAGQRGDIAVKVMEKLLSTYTEENASQAKEDARNCIITAIADPKLLLLNHLMSLKPIKALKGELIHDLLTIFVSSKLCVYSDFFKKHQEFVNNLGLNHDRNTKKMRLLTFLKLAENNYEMSFEYLSEKLRISENDIKDFIIQALKTKLFQARVDQAEKKIVILGTIYQSVDISLLENDNSDVSQENLMVNWKMKYYDLENLSDLSQRITKIAELGERFRKKKKRKNKSQPDEKTLRKHKVFLFLQNVSKLGDNYCSFRRSLEKATRTTDLNALAIQICIVYDFVQSRMCNLKIFNLTPQPLVFEHAYIELVKCIKLFNFQ